MENSRDRDSGAPAGSNRLQRKSTSSFPAPGNSREDQIVSKDFPIFEGQPQILPSWVFPVFPGKEAASRGHTMDGDGILLPVLHEPLFREDKWRQEGTFPRLERVENGIWDPPELPGVWDVIMDQKSLAAPSQGSGIPQNFQVLGF